MSPCNIFGLDLQLQKLQGRKKRGEEINIVDVNADDQIGDSAVLLTKYGTEEIAHRPSRVNLVFFFSHCTVIVTCINSKLYTGIKHTNMETKNVAVTKHKYLARNGYSFVVS